MRHFCLLLMSYVALTLDAGSSQWALPAGTAPQFLFLVAAIAALVCDGTGAIVWAVLIGLLTDAMSRGPMGLNVVLLSNLAFFGQRFGSRGVRESVFASGAMIWAFSTLASVGSLTLRSLLHGETIDAAYISQYSAGRAGAGVALFVIIMLSWKIVCSSLRFLLPSARVGNDRNRWVAGRA